MADVFIRQNKESNALVLDVILDGNKKRLNPGGEVIFEDIDSGEQQLDLVGVLPGPENQEFTLTFVNATRNSLKIFSDTAVPPDYVNTLVIEVD